MISRNYFENVTRLRLESEQKHASDVVTFSLFFSLFNELIMFVATSVQEHLLLI